MRSWFGEGLAVVAEDRRGRGSGPPMLPGPPSEPLTLIFELREIAQNKARWASSPVPSPRPDRMRQNSTASRH